MSTQSDTVSLYLRFPAALHRRLKREAERNKTSLNGEVVNQLQHLARELERNEAEHKQFMAEINARHKQSAAELASLRALQLEHLEPLQAEVKRLSEQNEGLHSMLVKLAQEAAKALSADQLGEVVQANVEKALTKWRQ